MLFELPLRNRVASRRVSFGTIGMPADGCGLAIGRHENVHRDLTILDSL